MIFRKTLCIIFCFECLLLGLPLRAQISDDFSDGNLATAPAWQGDLSEFRVNAQGELQLDAPDAGSSVLAVGGNIPDSAVWELDVRLEFAPSTSNLLRLYLLADQADLSNANGYFLEIGENGNLDALRFFRQDGAAKILLATGISGSVASDPVQIRVRVKRTKAGLWSLEMASATGPFQLQGNASDATYSGGQDRFFGLYCLYTATRKDKFFFDNLSILPDVPDKQPPVLLAAQAESATRVRAVFDEALEAGSALESAHYTVDGVAPVAVDWAGSSDREVFLDLPTPMKSGKHTLQAIQVSDTLGNVLALQSAEFQFVDIKNATEFDLLINEIMADPSPSAGLPDVEWLELFNRSDKIVDLQTLRLSDGGAPQPLPAYLLYPGAFVVLASTAGVAQLSPAIAPVLGMPGFPSLNNDGDALTLADDSGNLIDQVSYNVDWHTVADKRDGGWSLERRNPNTPCLGAENWQSCPVLPGGTPGKVNGAHETTPDATAPHLVAAFPETPNRVRVFFSEGLDRVAAALPASYRFEPARTISAAVPDAQDRTQVLLSLGEPLEKGILYALTATGWLEDCSGNAAANDTVRIGLAEIPAPDDIVVNEVMFNPVTGGSDYVELYNRSAKIFNWADFFLGNFRDGASVFPIGQNRLFLPGAYAVLTANPADLALRFQGVRPQDVLPTALPALDDDAGNVTLFWARDGSAVTLDSLDYSADWHNALLSSAEREGVSLERIRADYPTNTASNWTSSAGPGLNGAGTPTLPNSQRLPVGSNAGADLISVVPPRLSPDGDGYEDFLDIQYHLPAEGFSANWTIFDAAGVPVRQLANQPLAGTSGSLRWDGNLDDGSRARPGVYVLYASFFAPGGETRQVKLAIAVVQRF